MFLFHEGTVGEWEEDAEMSRSNCIWFSMGSSKEYEVIPAETEGGLRRDAVVGGSWDFEGWRGADVVPTKGTRFFLFRFAMRVFTPFEGCSTEFARSGVSTFISEMTAGGSL